AGDELGDAAFDGGFGFCGGEITDNLAAKCSGHSAEFAGGNFRKLEGHDKRRRENRLAGFFVEVDGDLDDGTGVNAKFAVDVAMDGQAMTAVATGHEGCAKRKAFYRAADRDALFRLAQSLADFFRNVYEADEPDFVNFRGEDVRNKR